VPRLAHQRHEIFQVSVMSALLDGVDDGEMTIGELLVVDGAAHQLHADGAVQRADPATRTPSR
jgi:acetolactate decarboxylase